MSLEITPIQLLTVCAVSNGLLFSGLLLAKKENHHANRFLALCLIAMSLTFTPYALGEDIWHAYRWLAWMPFSLSYWIGPAFYLYVRTLTANTTFSSKDLWHFSPLLLNYVHSFYHAALPHDPFLRFHAVAEVFESAAILSVAIYMVLSYRQIVQYQHSLLLRVSNVDTIDLRWVKQFLWVIGGVFTMILIFIISTRLVLGPESIYDWTSAKSVLMIFYVVVLYWLSITGYQQAQLIRLLEISDETTDEDPASYVIRKLTDLIEEEELYRRPELSLEELSSLSSISQRRISEAINQYLSKNFYRFINEFRVEYVLERLVDGQHDHLKIMSIAEEAGFNSKATFNRIFKAYVGMTPQQYKKAHAQQHLEALDLTRKIVE